MKKSFQAEIKAQNIYLAVQEINENEFMSQIQKDINEKKNRYKHLKHDFKKLHKKSHTLSKHLQLEILNNSPKTYKNLKKINQTQFLSSNETTQLLNNLSIVSSALNLNSSLTQNKFIAKSQILKRAPNLNEDSIFSILGLQTKNQASFSKRKSKASIFIDPNNHGEVEFQNSAKKEINSIPMSWKLAKIDYLSKNLKFTSCKMK